jgi:hypothetical protein
MYFATDYVIRDARTQDAPELARLGWEIGPPGQILVAEIAGVILAALALDDDRAAMVAVPGAPRVLAQLRARKAAIHAHRRMRSVAERIRERMASRVAV